MDMRPGGSVVRQGLYFRLGTWVLLVSTGRVVVGSFVRPRQWVLPSRVERDRRVERLGLLLTGSTNIYSYKHIKVQYRIRYSRKEKSTRSADDRLDGCDGLAGFAYGQP